MPCHAWKHVPTAISDDIEISKVPGCHLVTDQFLVWVTKITLKIGISWTHSLPFCFWTMFNSMNYGHIIKRCKPDNFESHNSLKLSFTDTWGLCLNFVDCKSFLKSNCPETLAICETNLDDSFDSSNFFVRGHLAQDLSLENSADSYLRFQLA